MAALQRSYSQLLQINQREKMAGRRNHFRYEKDYRAVGYFLQSLIHL